LQNSNINVTLGRPCSSPPLRRPPTPTPSLPVTRPPPAVHQIEYVRTNATKTQLSKTYEKTYNKRDPQPTRCTPMRIYAHTMRMPTSPCQHKLFNKSGLANVQNDSGFRLQRASDTCNAILQPNCLEHNYQGNVGASQPTNEPTNPWPMPCAPMRIYAHTMRVPTHPDANNIRETTPHAANRSPDRVCSHKFNQNTTFENT
jgi:hypothetical protein